MSNDKAKTKIKLIPDGPLEVTGLNSIKGKSGETTLESPSYLCRCGQSNNKPHCDGSHKEAGFKSTKGGRGIPDKVRDYKGSKITVQFNRAVCAHAGICIGSLKQVFDLEARPWIQPDNADAEEVIRVVDRCPSGALSYAVEGVHFPKSEIEISAMMLPNGPYIISGSVELMETKFGEGAILDKYALCRCGKSNNKPFCDGMHLGSKFE